MMISLKMISVMMMTVMMMMMRDRRVGRARGGVVAVKTWYYCTAIGAGV